MEFIMQIIMHKVRDRDGARVDIPGSACQDLGYGETSENVAAP